MRSTDSYCPSVIAKTWFPLLNSLVASLIRTSSRTLWWKSLSNLLFRHYKMTITGLFSVLKHWNSRISVCQISHDNSKKFTPCTKRRSKSRIPSSTPISASSTTRLSTKKKRHRLSPIYRVKARSLKKKSSSSSPSKKIEVNRRRPNPRSSI